MSTFRSVLHPTSIVLKKIENAQTVLECLEVGIKFFSNPESYQEQPIGWGESDLPVRDDGREVANAVLERVEKLKAQENNDQESLYPQSVLGS